MSRLPLHVFTLALDAMPWLACVFAELSKLRDVPWRWTVVEGAAMNGGSTRWMNRQAARLSADGTTEFLLAIASHPRVTVIQKPEWPSKDAMVNAAVATFREPGVLLQNDADELWGADQYRRIVELFEDDPGLGLARFDCDYMLGPNIRTTDAGKPEEWLRAWRFAPGMTFASHEPPVLAGNRGRALSRTETAALGLRFQHHAWTLPRQVHMKERLYGKRYEGALAGWMKLQENATWPLRDVGQYLPAAFRGAPADRIFT